MPHSFFPCVPLYTVVSYYTRHFPLRALHRRLDTRDHAEKGTVSHDEREAAVLREKEAVLREEGEGRTGGRGERERERKKAHSPPLVLPLRYIRPSLIWSQVHHAKLVGQWHDTMNSITSRGKPVRRSF